MYKDKIKICPTGFKNMGQGVESKVAGFSYFHIYRLFYIRVF